MDDDRLEQRLRALGTAPVPPEVAARHLAAIAAVAGGRREPAVGGAVGLTRRRAWRSVASRRLAAVAAACVVVGSTGLATAGALPDTAQRIAHDLFDAVGVDVPDAAPASTEQPTTGDRGDGLARPLGAEGGTHDAEPATPVPTSSVGDDRGGRTDAGDDGDQQQDPAPAAQQPTGDADAGADPTDGPADSDTPSEGGPPTTTPTPTTQPTTPTTRGGADPSCTGPPAWVLDPDMTKEEKDAAQAERRARCGGGGGG